MSNSGIIGHTGFLGTVIKSQFAFTNFYNSANIKTLADTEFDLLVCSAPTGNRLAVNADCVADFESTLQLINNLRKTKTKQFVLIGTIDAMARPDSKYGLNRRLLEDWVKTNIKDYSIIRLPMIIHTELRKNVLYDLKHGCYLDSINLESTMQYYDLSNIKKDIDFAIANNIRELNLVSEPIRTGDVVATFFPELKLNGSDAVPLHYNVMPYRYTKEEVLKSMGEYFNG